MNVTLQLSLLSRLRLIALFLVAIVSADTHAVANEVNTDSEGSTRPNIVFIFADDWGWGDLSCHGHESYETPNLDRLARLGTDFTEFTVANPVCSPSRTAVMTGHFPARHSVHRHFWNLMKNQEFGMPDWLDPNLVMLPRLFQEAGYRTGHFGKWHLCGRGYSGPPEPAKYGYDESAVYGGPGPKADPKDSSTFDKAIDFIRANKGAPFFVNVWIHETHTPHFPKDKFLKKYAGLDERQQVYAAIVAEADYGIGRILDALDELNLANNTLVVFSSDNGPEEPSRSERQRKMQNGLGLYYSVGSTGGLKGRKRSLYEGGIRVPFIVRWPGKTPESRVNDTTVLTGVDLLPTFCAAAGIPLPQGYQADGENLLQALLGNDVLRTKPIFWEWTGPRVAGWAMDPSVEINWPRLGVRDGDWKLLLDYDTGQRELYKVSNDRTEQNDLSVEHPEILDKLSTMVQQWKSQLPQRPPPHCISPERIANSRVK